MIGNPREILEADSNIRLEFRDTEAISGGSSGEDISQKENGLLSVPIASTIDHFDLVLMISNIDEIYFSRIIPVII